MKIISKFKDFYDHKVATYGMDPRLVFDRRNKDDHVPLYQLPPPPAEWARQFGACVTVAWLYVGNWEVALFNSGTRVYSAFDIENVQRKTPTKYRRTRIFIRFHDGQSYDVAQYAGWQNQNTDFSVKQGRQAEALRPYHDVPLLLAYYPDVEAPQDLRLARFAFNPQLSTLGVYIDADWLWQRLCEYLSQLKSEAEVMPLLSDQDKIRNKGFDMKTSFRPKMKSRKP